MNQNQFGRDQRDFIRFRESDSPDRGFRSEDDFETDGSFTNSNFHFDDQYYGKNRQEGFTRRDIGRLGGRNRFGEERIRHDSFQDDQFRNDYDPTYEDEYGMRHPYEHGGSNRWSDDIRSESSHENHFGKGPRGYQRSENRIIEEASEILARDFNLDASDIEIEVKDRCLYLKGEVHSRKDKRMAEELVEDVSGIDDVQNQLKIKKKIEGWIPSLGNVKDLSQPGG